MDKFVIFNVLEDEYEPVFIDKKNLKHITSVAIHANKEISLISLSGIVEFIEQISGEYDFEWYFELDSKVPEGKVIAYLYPMVV